MTRPDWKRIYRVTLMVLLVAAIIYFLYLIRGIFLSLLLAIVLAYLLHPLVRVVEDRGTSRTMSILLVYAVVFILVASLLLFGMPHIIAQLNMMADVVPEYATQIQEFTDSIQVKYAKAGIPDALRKIIDQRITWVEHLLVKQAERVVQVMLSLASYIFNIVLAPIIAFYLIKDVELFTDRAIQFIPRAKRVEFLELGSEISRVIDNFVRGYLLVSVITGLMTGLAMAALGMDLALMLGIFAGLTNLIPYFGPFIGAVPAITLAMLVSKWMVLKVVLAFVVIQQLEASVISPKILGTRVGLHPLFVILVLLAGGELYGLTGLILAVPVAAVLRILVIYSYSKLIPEFK